jgi:predicted DNA binding protein
MMPKEGGVLSSAEHDVLAVAYENGYFNTPREITQRELADLVGISENAVSKQLRTAIKLVVEEKLYGPGGEPYL